MTAACGGRSDAPLPAASQTAQSPLSGRSVAEVQGWRPIYATLPARGVDFTSLDAQSAAGATLPAFTSSVKSPLDGNLYTYHILGKNPSTSTTTTNITYVPIVAIITFGDGTVLDPTKPGCGDTISVENRFFKGPNFAPVNLASNGVAVGPAQLGDAHQRAEFWSHVNGDRYHTVLTTSIKPIVIHMTAPPIAATAAGACAGKGHRIGAIEIDEFDYLMRKIDAKYATTSQLPLVLTYNVFETDAFGNCCIIGYHSAFHRTTGTQVYAVGAYNDSGIFNAPVEDVDAWTHEIGETFNDPFVNNATPAWGNIGQVSGCQNNLEVGDPLTGTAYTLSMNGFTYHPQELAFFDWFYRTPSHGTAGKYSFRGTFTTTQPLCT